MNVTIILMAKEVNSAEFLKKILIKFSNYLKILICQTKKLKF